MNVPRSSLPQMPITLEYAPRVLLVDSYSDITAEPLLLGRAQFNDRRVSREQCRLQLVGGLVELTSLGKHATLVLPLSNAAVPADGSIIARNDSRTLEGDAHIWAASAPESLVKLTHVPRIRLADGSCKEITEQPLLLGRKHVLMEHAQAVRCKVSRGRQCRVQLVGGRVVLTSLGKNATPVRIVGVGDTKSGAHFVSPDCSLILTEGAQICLEETPSVQCLVPGLPGKRQSSADLVATGASGHKRPCLADINQNVASAANGGPLPMDSLLKAGKAARIHCVAPSASAGIPTGGHPEPDGKNASGDAANRLVSENVDAGQRSPAACDGSPHHGSPHHPSQKLFDGAFYLNALAGHPRPVTSNGLEELSLSDLLGPAVLRERALFTSYGVDYRWLRRLLDGSPCMKPGQTVIVDGACVLTRCRTFLPSPAACPNPCSR